MTTCTSFWLNQRYGNRGIRVCVQMCQGSKWGGWVAEVSPCSLDVCADNEALQMWMEAKSKFTERPSDIRTWVRLSKIQTQGFVHQHLGLGWSRPSLGKETGETCHVDSFVLTNLYAHFKKISLSLWAAYYLKWISIELHFAFGGLQQHILAGVIAVLQRWISFPCVLQFIAL